MRNKINCFYFAIVSCLFLFLPNGLRAEEVRAKQNVLAILPLTGSLATLGQNSRHGLELAMQQMSESDRSSINLIFEDDGFQPARAISAFRKVQSSNKLAAVMVLGSSIGHAIAPIAEEAKIPMFALDASDGNVVKNRKYAFLHWVIPKMEAVVLVKEVKTMGYKNIALVTAEHEGALALYNDVVAEFKSQGLENLIKLDEKILPGDMDFRTIVTKARAARVDAIVVALFPGVIAPFAKQVQSSLKNVALIGIETFEDDNEVKAAQGALLNQWYVTAGVAADWFEQDYRKAYNEQPGLGAANAYDALNLLKLAWKSKVVDAENLSVVNYLDTVKDFKGAAGTYSATGDGRFTLPATVKIITERGFERKYKE